MSTEAEVAHRAMISEASGILAGVLNTPWPQAREARKAIGYAAARASECRDVYILLLNEEMEPLSVPAESKGWWAGPLPDALEWAADQALEAAKAARNRLAEYARRGNEAAGEGSDRGVPASIAGAIRGTQ